ncbi:MAG: phospholipase D-like domain-containing protein [Acidimicrobiales bacterium]
MSGKALWGRTGLFALVISAVLTLVTAAGAVVPALAGHARARAGPDLVAVIVEPSRLGSTTGMTPVYDFVLSARKSVDMTMYELVDPTMVSDLVADQRRHVKVRVILDTNREASRNGPAFQALRAGGVNVVWADTSYEATHQKTITVDGAESLILSANLTAEYYATTRDFGVFDSNPKDVAAIEAVFDADFAHEPVSPSDGSDLVWSPGSQAQMLAVINGAGHTLSIENEEMGDSTITDAIVAASRRGVNVEVTMTEDSSYDSDWDAIVSAGGHVHLYSDGSSDLYIHAKTTIADAGFSDQRIYVGSINFSRASMDDNRELGVITTDATIVHDVNAVVAGDYSECTPATECSNYH